MEDSGEDYGTLTAFTFDDNDGWDVEELEAMEFEEKTVAEVMKCLEEEIARPSSAVNAAGYGAGIYYKSPLYVDINGNVESCGPAFSDAASSVMASVDTSGGGLSYFSEVPVTGPFCGIVPPPNAGDKPWEMVDGIDEDDEEWLDRVLGGPMIELDDDDALFE